MFSSTAFAASLFDPALRFRVLSTAHFRIYYHQGGEQTATRLATIAEQTWTALGQSFDLTPPPITHVVLTDQSELANGYATPLPRDTIVMYTVSPRGNEFYTDDWLRLAFSHEFTHIVHLDRSESWARGVRAVFGRTPLAFPNLLLPIWQIEGLAAYEESVMTGEGRLHAGEFRAIVEEAARRQALEPLDRINGGLTDWPGSTAPYAYGLGFHSYLVDRFGEASLGRLAEATARRVPYTSSRAFKTVFGASLGGLWRDYEAGAPSAAGPPMSDPGSKQLTQQGFIVAAPRFDRFACQGCPSEILYASATPHEFPSLNRLRLDGSAPRRITRRYLGSTTAPGPDAVYFDQLEIRRNVGRYADLYALSRRSGRSRQVTFEARLTDPDFSPDGTTIACVQQRPGRRDLVLVRDQGAATVETLLSEPDTQFNAPRWSPDGRQIVAERHRLGGQPEVVVLDLEAHALRVIAAEPSTRFVTPAWRPDGLAIVAAASTEERPFNLFEISTDHPHSTRQLTHSSGGAIWPEISPDGQTLLFAGYTVRGFDLFAMPYPHAVSPGAASSLDSSATPAGETLSSAATPTGANGETKAACMPVSVSASGAAVAVGPGHDYTPWPTIGPTSWFPLVQVDSTQLRVGAAVSGGDLLGYHRYAASATWLVTGPANAPTPSAATPDWSVSHLYDRWRPAPFVAASLATSFLAGPATAKGTPVSITRRERQLVGGLEVPIMHTRVSHLALGALTWATDDYLPPAGLRSRDRTSVQLAWRTTTAHTYGYSIGPERGIAVGATAEFVRRALGASADARVVTGDLRAYLPGLRANHVIAARLAGGSSEGDPIVGRTFLLGGAFPDASVIDFGSGAIRLLRGFPANSFAGSHVALANADYRWPIARPQRGVGTWPLFVHTIHAAVFADAGHAWTRSFDARAIKTSAGAELSTDIIAGYYFPFTVAAGAAWGHDGSGTIASGVTTYIRAGKAF